MKISHVLYASGLLANQPTVYLIRHGEKPPVGDGLNLVGEQRAQCLREVFNAKSDFNIGYIFAEEWQRENGKGKRAYDTVVPLSRDLNLPISQVCGRDDVGCINETVRNYQGDGNILISWNHNNMERIQHALGVGNPTECPDDRFDLVWTIPYPYDKVVSKASQKCPGLDDDK